ncbi:MAG: hypothetical protein IPK16_09635 [Anaerolineales bacterium]|nr:hypothetical protein [Anaerolineales bacterium]
MAPLRSTRWGRNHRRGGWRADIATLATALANAGPALPELAPRVAALDKTLQGLPVRRATPPTGCTAASVA